MTTSYSLHRVAQLYRFNLPWFRKQLLAYLAVSVATALLYIFGKGHIWQSPVNSICNLALAVMFILSPLVFIKGGDARIVERLIPASAVEKFTVHITWMLLMIPVCFLFPWIAEKIFADDFRIMAGMEHQTPAVFDWISYLSALAAMFTCYYCVVFAKANRMLKGVIFSFVVIIAFNIIGAVFVAMEAFIIGYNAGAAGIGTEPDANVIAQQVTDAMFSHLGYTYIIVGVYAAYIVLMLGLSYRSIHRRNL